MNSREAAQKKNTTCVKVSACGRACQLDNPQREDQPYKFFFDKIYQPGVTQEDVYEYTGKPLVEAMKEGYNSTIFAYGQTGSGKTFSMMGILGTALRGIQPRIIEDVFDYIENLPADCEDRYSVQISMCEIYLERIKDLFNPINDNLKVRDSPEKGIYVQDITENECHSAAEVLEAMSVGFMNRATSATKMNPESSRSHCVTILKVTCLKPNGSKVVSKIKMVDLAGSEKTSKTEATGNRLREAMAINQSLTALSKVLKALVEGGGKFIPYRDSKLTRLLEDALGGNSKTSLIVAASPCTYNLEETVSALRFGKRAKQVKTHAVINQDLSMDDMKKSIKKLETEVTKLTMENKILRLKTECVAEFLGGKGFSYEQVTKDVKIASDNDEEKLDITEFCEVSSSVCEIKKETGEMIGEHIEASVHNMKKADLEAKRAALRKENERLAGIVAGLIAQGNYSAVGDLLKGKLSIAGSMSAESADVYEDQIADLKAELRGTDSLAEQYADELEAAENRIDDAFHKIQALQAQLAEHRFYKQKVEFLERETAMLARSSKSMIPAGEEDTGDFNLDSLLADVPASHADLLRQKMEPLAKALAKKDRMLKRMKSESRVGLDDILDALNATGDKAAAVKKIFEMQKKTTESLHQQTTMVEKLKRTCAMQQRREKHWKELQTNWQGQLKQMEAAVLTCAKIQKRDKTKFVDEMKVKDEMIMKLKAALITKQKIIESQKNKTVMPMNEKRFGAKARRRPRKARPARASCEGSEAGSDVSAMA